MRLSKLVLELVPATLLLLMAFLTFLSAISRYALNTPIPDEYEVSRMLLGIVVCWGVAAAFYYNDHIFLDVMWGRAGRRTKLWLSRLGNLLSLGIMSVFSIALAFKVLDTMRSGLITIDLGISVWGFQLAAWLGTVAAVFILAGRTVWPLIHEIEDEKLEQAL